ncbi:multidrug efflux transporter AcrB transmembrane domain-containing protein [Violaceomyces palustris]|uniref:Multidrug efflux transporter AcrB transmembrane domain-containing protein n=1 Tax=Violaceomyces palustris TaxID=1673888 RepID=A0ACD0P037_9BASI|nr:multidrug efflux transporter AcrB transmembrane domain-containing protein [Violaceomyces palustris]
MVVWRPTSGGDGQSPTFEGARRSGRTRPPGKCNMRGNCGRKNFFSPPLPCPQDHVDAELPREEDFRRSLVQVCGPDYARGPVCCTSEQLESLSANLQQAEPLISSCPACRNNFRDLFCSFTCSPNQSQFLDVSSTQQVTGEDGTPSTAVKSVEFYISDAWKRAFYDSCKDVKFSASNGFVMDLIGGGAKDPDAFLKYLGDERPLVGSPFQINFPPASQTAASDGIGFGNATKPVPPLPFDPPPRHCSDPDLLSRCTCVDCPDVCATLPHLDPPSSRHSTCNLGTISCYSFAVLLLYAISLLVFAVAFRTSSKSRRKGRTSLRHRASGFSDLSDGSGFERVRLNSDDYFATGNIETPARGSTGRRHSSVASTPPSNGDGLIGARGLGHYTEEDSTSSSAPDSFGRGLGVGVGLGTTDALNALGTTQPRTYAVSNLLSRFFYRLGLRCAKSPWLTFGVAALLVSLAHIGWRSFEVETDPVRLWVASKSESKMQKEYFDHEFGPFYRTEQIFVMDATAYQGMQQVKESKSHLTDAKAALDWERLKWWSDVEDEIRNLRSTPNAYSLQDVCFAPAGRGSPCVVQSLMGYFQDDLEGNGIGPENWAETLDTCALNPAECLPAFQQPLKQNIVLGGIPETVKEAVPGGGEGGGQVRDRPGRPSDARAAVVTYVIDNSLNRTEVARAEEWERALERLLFSIAGLGSDTKGGDQGGEEHELARRGRELGIRIAFSTGVSLEQEIGSSSNTDVGIVVLSYLLMFLYAALTLGGPSSDPASSRPVLAPGNNSHHGAHTTAQRERETRGGGLAARVLSFLPHGSSRDDRSAQNRQDARPSWIRRLLLKPFFRGSKFSLGLFGIVIVLVSVSAAVGIFSAIGVKVTLIIAEVIPFMLLAVGVDNIFLLCNEMDRQNLLARKDQDADAEPSLGGEPSIGIPTSRPFAAQSAGGDDDDLSSEDNLEHGYGSLSAHGSSRYRVPSHERAARALSRMGPSILLSATTQVTAFLLGALVPMPAVRNFALYAAGSMLIASTLHCTVFVAAMALDADRVESGRFDCLPCVKIRDLGRVPHDSLSAQPATSSGNSLAGEGMLARFIRLSYAPTLLRPGAKRAVIAMFVGLLALSSIGVRKVEMGLDQRLALPANSYLRAYFDAIDAYLDVGPPVYFVARGVDPTLRQGQQALCGRFTTCQDLSLANTLEGERRRPQVSFLAEPASSWVDDFLQWLNPVLESCCRVRRNDPDTFCRPNDREALCQPCFLGREPSWNITMDGLPEDGEFMRYLLHWLESPTDSDCPLGGQASYSSAISLDRAQPEGGGGRGGGGGEVGETRVEASHFRTYFTPLRSQSDFIEALKSAQRISSEVSSRTGVEVFAFSVFFVFFSQYTSLATMATQVLGAAALSVFGITTLLLGSWRSAAVVTLCVSSSVLGVAAMMGVWGVEFNALTLVNLSVCSAISVEFCAHVARAFMRAPGSLPRSHPMSQRERDERAWAALVDVGSSVFSGIFCTKLLGVCVLIFTKSDLLKLYYAKTWLSLIVLGLVHGLVLLPVLLSYLGGRGFSSGEEENDVKRRLRGANEEAEEYGPLTQDTEQDDETGSE